LFLKFPKTGIFRHPKFAFLTKNFRQEDFFDNFPTV